MMKNIEDLRQEVYDNYRKKNPKVYLRNAAQDLKVSEVQLLSLSCGENAHRLNLDLDEIFSQLCEIGKLMAICRNDNAVSEITGNLIVEHSDDLIFELAIENFSITILRKYIASIFAFADNDRFSLQFFDHFGGAVQKFFLSSNFDDFR